MSLNSYTKDDFSNSTEVRWCPGCGDYAILAALQRTLPELGLAPEQHVFVSGIGCAGRLPYYMNTYGFHTIHGRATAVATGLKALREDVCVWVITGDGDALSIGANHLIHSLRRNININILLFNNQVYGLTKGQFSPTSQLGQKTKTSPYGVESQALNPIFLALGAGASFIGRAVDKDPTHLGEVLKQAYLHQGTSFVEIYQDCNIFNHGAFDDFSLKANRSNHTLVLKQGEPMFFGEKNTLGLYLTQEGFEIKHRAEERTDPCIHDETDLNLAVRLAHLHYPAFPVPLGVYYRHDRPVFKLRGTHQAGIEELKTLYRARGSWCIV